MSVCHYNACRVYVYVQTWKVNGAMLFCCLLMKVLTRRFLIQWWCPRTSPRSVSQLLSFMWISFSQFGRQFNFILLLRVSFSTFWLISRAHAHTLQSTLFNYCLCLMIHVVYVFSVNEYFAAVYKISIECLKHVFVVFRQNIITIRHLYSG